MMERRELLKMLSFFVVDPEKLLWIPGKKTIFIPNEIDIAALEWEKLTRQIPSLFDRDHAFFKAITSRNDDLVNGTDKTA